MADYIIDFTDPGNGSFIIKPFTTNGPASPIAASPLDANATAANTSIVLLGKGMFEYGERFQESVVHMLEHFAYATAPVYPNQGQIWYKNTTTELFVYDGVLWISIPLSGVPSSVDLDMNGFKIINLGNATSPTDALNQQTGDLRYVNVTGDTMSGLLILSADPGVALGAATKQYVDNSISALSTVYVNVTGDTMTGPLVVNADFSITGVRTIDVGANKVINAANPTNPQDLATKFYVDSTNDGTLTSGSLNVGTGDLTLNSTVGGPVIVSGIAPFVHTHTTPFIFHNLDPQYDNSYLREQLVDNILYPLDVPFDIIVDVIDQALYTTTANLHRQIIQTDGVATTYPTDFSYLTQTNKLSVYANGVKQYLNQRAQWDVEISSSVNIGTSTTLTATTYNFDIVVNGITFSIIVDLTTAFAPIKYSTLITAINAGLITAMATLGYQIVNVGGTRVGADVTGLANNATVYTATITVNGTPFPITVTGSTAQIYTDLLSEINNDLGVNATATLSGGNIKVTSNSTGTSSTINIVDTGGFPLFSSLTTYVAILAAVPGTDAAIVRFRDSNITFYSATQGISSSLFVNNVGATPLFTALNIPITTATTAPDTFTVSGVDYSTSFPTDGHLVVFGSTFNDGTYIVAAPGASFSLGITTIPVTTVVTPSGADGNIGVTFTMSPLGSHAPITAVTVGGAGTGELKIAGNYTTTFTNVGTQHLIVFGSTNNNKTFSVRAPSTFAAGSTTIPVNESVAAVADGTVYFWRTLAYAENGTPFSTLTPGTDVIFTVAPVAGQVVEILIQP